MMKATTLKLFEPAVRQFPRDTDFKMMRPTFVFCTLLLLWFCLPVTLQYAGLATGSVDQGIWLLVILSLISFMLIVGLCWWLFQYFWYTCGLSPLNHMVSQFNTLPLWQQLGFYWASFALLLLAALGSLIAIC